MMSERNGLGESSEAAKYLDGIYNINVILSLLNLRNNSDRTDCQRDDDYALYLMDSSGSHRLKFRQPRYEIIDTSLIR